jgi:SAM-dependent methyltransferase
MPADSPFPELKKTHSMARRGRPWRDYKPPPSAPVWGIIQGYGSYWALVAAVDLGVFDGIQRLGPCSATVLAENLSVSAVHLTHVLDTVVTFGFLDQVDDIYELTETAERYLCTDGPASMAKLVHVAPGPLGNWTHLADTIRTGVVSEPIEADPVAFYGPLVQATYATQHRAATRLGLRLAWARRPGLRVLDLGAGLAPWSIAVLQQSPGSSAVVNDLAGVIELARGKVDELGLTERVAFLAGDFHQVSIDSEAFDIVVLGHVCRTEGDTRARQLVERAYHALRPEGQLLLADYFATDDRKSNPFGVQMGLTMLANTERGGMITSPQVHCWLVDVGFEAIRMIEPIGFTSVFVASKPSQRKPVPQ